MYVNERQSGDRDELTRCIRQEKDAPQRDRYRVVALAIDGHPTATIEQMTARSRGFVQRWAYAYRDGGIAAIAPRRRGGSQPKLDSDQQKRFVERFTAGPTHVDGGVCTLRGKDAQRILEQEFRVNYSLNGVYALLDRLGLSCLKPRPQHRKNDPKAMQQWRERAPLLSRQSSSTTQTVPSKSGSRMKRDSGSKAH